MMALNKNCLVYGLLFCLFLPACRQKETPKAKSAVFRLFDIFQPEDLAGKVTPANAGWKRTEWRAVDMSKWTPPLSTQPGAPLPSAVFTTGMGFRAVHDLGEILTKQNQLSGESTGPAPVLQLALSENRGGARSPKFIEVRMIVSGARQIWLRTEGGASVDDAAMARWASQSEPWSATNDVVEGSMQTYRFEIQASRGTAGGPGGPPPPMAAPRGDAPAAAPKPVAVNNPVAAPVPAVPPGPPPGGGGPSGTNASSAELKHILLAFRECKSARFAIESVRILTEKEDKLTEPSGQQWAGMAEIFHATLAAKTSETIRIPLRELPESARLDFAYGTKEDEPVRFKVTIADRDGPKELTPSVLFERTVTIPNRWRTAKVDLTKYVGKSVVLDFSLIGERKGLWGYWGSPVVRSHLTALPPVNAKAASSAMRKPRGVILLVIDTLRKDHLNIYGYPRETLVHLKKFANEGVAFNHAISQGTMTKISVPSIVTSLYPLSHTVLGFEKGLPASAKTIAEVFREEGYATVAYSSVGFTGKGNNMHQGYDELHESGSITDSEYRSKTARHYVDRLIPWIEEHRDAPFFAFLHVFDPHSPFRPRPPYDTIWGAPGSKERLAELEADMRQKKVRTGMDSMPSKEDYMKTGNSPEELLKIYTDWYDGSIRGVDAEIGRLLEALREMGLEQETLFVWATDHGEEFWEHGKMFHGHSVYGELNQVPMVFHWPNCPDIRKGVMVDQQVENIDIMPTILSLVGISGPTNMQGRSLVPLLNGSGAASWQERPALTQAMVRDDPPPGAPADGPRPNTPEKPHFGIIDRGWKLVRKEVNPEAKLELYDHPVDPLNLTNVSQGDAPASRLKALGQTLETWKTRARAAQLPSDETMTQQMSSEELRRLRALGYVGGGPPQPATTKAVPSANAANTNANTNTNTNAGVVKKDAGK